MQEQLESTPAGRALVHFFLFITLFSLLVANLPPSGLRRSLGQVPNAYIESTGLTQRWGVFSPNPRSVSLDFRARIVYEDGTQDVWVPSRDLFLGALSLYRWRKWYEKATGDATPEDLSRAAASWIARRHSSPRRAVTSVELIQLTREIHPPGAGVDATWQEESYYVLEPAPGDDDA